MEKLHRFGVRKKPHTWCQKWCQKTLHNESWRKPQNSASGPSGGLFSTHHSTQPGFSGRETSVGGAGATEATKKEHQRERRETEIVVSSEARGESRAGGTELSVSRR